MTGLLDDPAQFIAIVRADWLVTASGRRLHWAEIGEEHYAGIAMDWAVTDPPLRLACGRWADYACIPGVLSRLSLPRCVGCCRVLGYPQGKGSPKNDAACRRILGLATASGNGKAH